MFVIPRSVNEQAVSGPIYACSWREWAELASRTQGPLAAHEIPPQRKSRRIPKPRQLLSVVTDSCSGPEAVDSFHCGISRVGFSKRASAIPATKPPMLLHRMYIAGSGS